MLNTVVADRFALRSAISKAGSRSVYRAEDLQTHRTVAVKLVRVDGAFDEARFEREAATLASLHHRNVVAYVAHGRHDGMHYIAQDWIEGPNLSQFMGTTGITAREALGMAREVAAALAATHSIGIVHRDVKPSNIVLANGDPFAAKLVDFGIARRVGHVGAITSAGMVIGTPAYMAPEQARGAVNIDPAADIWALGCVLYEAVTGRMAFTGPTMASVRAKVIVGDPPAAQLLAPELHADLVELLDEALRKEPSQRPPNGLVFGARLAALSEVNDGPRRRTTASEPKTQLVPRRTNVPSLWFTMVAPTEVVTEIIPDAIAIASRHAMTIAPFEDFSLMLICRVPGKDGALSAVRAAIALRAIFPAAGICTFAQSRDESVEQAIDRGALLLEVATMTALFDDDDGPLRRAVHLDPALVEIVTGELEVTASEHGPIIVCARE